jgi:hypothetical protein
LLNQNDENRFQYYLQIAKYDCNQYWLQVAFLIGTITI